MSGICGIWRKENVEGVSAVLSGLNAGLALHGDDNFSAMEVAGAGGVAARARVDSSQIFRNARVVLACDADLLNTDDLMRSLELGGQSVSPAELLALLYERHGEQFAEQLRGGFSVILLDLVEHRLVAAVDGFGIKRLAWYQDHRGVVVGSRADALRAGIERTRINPRSIANVLNFTSNLGPETIFAGVHRLAPGMLLTASAQQTRTHPYWDMHYAPAAHASEARLSGELESVLEGSVAAHCAGEPIPNLGGFLSGGTDSSTVIGLMTRTAGAPVKAFSIGFAEEGFNELEYARIAAQAFGSRHHTYLVTAADCLDSLPGIVRAFDEPFGNSSAIATYFCARLAVDHGVTTLLAGDGGDELFGGNERYATEKIFEAYQAVPTFLRTALIEPVSRLPIDVGLMRKARGYIRRANMGGIERMLSFQFLRTNAPADVFDGDFLRSLADYTVLDIPSAHYRAARGSHHLDRMLYVDMKITLADNDLPKVTCMSDLAGIRTRFPFLDRQVAEFAGRVPARLKVRGFEKRYLFKRAFRRLLPAEIIKKKKHGFGIPVAVWMKTDARMRDLTHDTLRSARAHGRGYFRKDFIEELLRRHDAGDDTFYGDTLWALLMLELWHRQAIDEPARVVA